LRDHAGEKQTLPGDNAHALSGLQPGQSGRVVSIESTSEARLERLSVFGLTPGAQVTLQQRHPTFVLRVGYTELSLERQVADEIIVQPL
jgi:DtxR family Mn-dependent transcriptional regulator